MDRCRKTDLCIENTLVLDSGSGITNVMRITILILCIMILDSGLPAQSLVLYSKKGRILKSDELFTIENRSIVYRDSNLVKKVVPVKALREIRYALKSYRPLGNVFIFSGGFIIGSALLPSVLTGDPEFLVTHAKITVDQFQIEAPIAIFGMVSYLTGWILNKMGALIGRDVVYYDVAKLNYDNRKMILESIIQDMVKRKKGKNTGEYQYRPEGRKRSRLLGLSWEGKTGSASEWLRNKNLKERKFLEFGWKKDKK